MVIAGPNLSLDRTIGVSRFDPGHIHRAERVEARIGGGGANAARVASALHARATLVTMIPELGAPGLSEGIGGDGITVDWVTCRGQLRTATILREGWGRVTVLNEPGPGIEPPEWEAYVRLVASHLRRSRGLLCSGSLPPGVPHDGYVRLARQAQNVGSACIVDVAGEPLSTAVESGECIVAPNLAEAEILLHGPRAQAVASDDDQPERAQDAAQQLLRLGAARAVVTAGKAGAAYAEAARGACGWVGAPRVEAHSPIGAGDAFACALGIRLQGGAQLGEAVGYATAVAGAYVESPTGEISRGRVNELTESAISRRVART